LYELDDYECLVIAGGMGEGHIPVSAIDEMIRVVKPGNHHIFIQLLATEIFEEF